ncbi:hypothetical protein Btru_060491 [Bulinus truncatus]|nr:hypothetical protein Btru_060491 [Bulinus truncatus]
MDIYSSLYDIMTRSTVVVSSDTYPEYNRAMRNQMSRRESMKYDNRTTFIVSRISGEGCRCNVMLAVVMFAVLSAVIIVPLVNQTNPLKGREDHQEDTRGQE